VFHVASFLPQTRTGMFSTQKQSGVTGIRPGLTPVGAGGLLIIMSGATVINLIDGATALALFTALLGALAGLVAYGRWTRAQRARASAKA
jgi:hypothetical protein